MATVDPFLLRIPRQIIDNSDNETRLYHEEIGRFLREIWSRSGGANDAVEDVEASVTVQDGGNRSTRFQHDQIEEVSSKIDQMKRSIKNDSTESLGDELASIKRKLRSFESDIQELRESATCSCRCRNNDDKIDELSVMIERQKRLSSRIEQDLNEIIGRVDDGT